jgi:hypothetical protein
MLETWQGEVMRWNAGPDVWQRKIQDIKNELEQSNREVRMLKEKQIREVRLSPKELEVTMLRDEVKAMEEASRKRYDTGWQCESLECCITATFG